MNDMNTLANLVTFASTNLAYNLDFIPADKADWKPEPDAKSAIEVVNEVIGNFRRFAGRIQSGGAAPTAASPVTSLEEAKAALKTDGAAAAKAMREATPETLSTTIEVRPGMDLPLSTVALMVTVDAIHHHGQIAYIQTLLGDADSHFDPAVFRTP